MESLYRKFEDQEGKRKKAEGEQLCKAAQASAEQTYRSQMQMYQMQNLSIENLRLQHMNIKHQVLEEFRKRLGEIGHPENTARFCSQLEEVSSKYNNVIYIQRSGFSGG